jgi:hypothetical protein
MRITESDVKRKTVIESYVRYDCSKTGRPMPDCASWDWSDADAIDRDMKCSGLKTGIPAGYRLWYKVEVTMPDLLNCAVDISIFPGQSRRLGLVERAAIVRWKPDRQTLWYEQIVNGQTCDETAPLLLRPTVSCEFPASWYIEDGSGRAIAFVANQIRFDPSQALAVGYLGREPDLDSSFMRNQFPELLSIRR